MAADTLSSASITNLDTIPFVANNPGEGGSGYLRDVSDYVTPTTGGLASTSSIYKMVRLPTGAKLKKLQLFCTSVLDSNASPTLAVDVGAYYSDSTIDGTPVADQGVSISAACFLSNVAFGAATTKSVDALQALSPQKRNEPLWQAVGLAADPGGFIDIVVAVHAAAATAASQQMGIDAQYVV
jgi:hypothetical protein